MNQKYFKDKKIWITGASSGIGKGFALELSRLGAYLILSSRRKSALDEVVSELAFPEKAEVVTIDMENQDSIDSACKQILLKHKIDIAILNAGISQRSHVAETNFETEAKIMNTNFHGLVRAAKHLLAPMLQSGSGHFVIMSSVTGKIGVPGRSSYAASKHALHGYFDSLRAEVEDQGIKVTMICPGYVFTNISSNAVLGNGKSHSNIDLNSKNGLSVEKFSRKALKGISRKKREMIIGGRETMGIYLKRFFPALLFNAVKKIKA